MAQIQQTSYTSYAYLIPSHNTAPRLTRHAREDLARCDHSVRCHFPIKVRGTAKGKKREAPAKEDPPPQDTATTSKVRLSHPTKRKREEVDDPEEGASVIEISSDAAYEDDETLEANPPPRSRGDRKPLGSGTRKAEARPNVTKVDFDSEEELDVHDSEEGDVWTYSHRPHPRRRRRTESPATMADLSDF